MSMDIVNIGYTETILQNNKDKYINKVEWEGKYDGKKANIDVNINDNGHKENIKLKLNNSQIIDMLNYPSINKPIDQRLLDDYFSESSIHKKYKKKGSKKKGNRKLKGRKTKSVKYKKINK